MGKSPLIVLAVLTLTGAARAAPPVDTSPGVVFEDCRDAPLGKDAFLRALGVELGSFGLPSSSGATPQIAVTFSCDDVASIRIVIGPSAEDRAVRLDDVPSDERPRALALVVAELILSRARASADTPSADSARGGPSSSGPRSAEAGTISTQAQAPGVGRGADSPTRPGAVASVKGQPKISYWCGGGARLTIGVGRPSYGGHLGVSRGPYRVQADAQLAHARVARGAIDAGLAAIRLRRSFPLVVTPDVEVELDLSGALGMTWAVGSSSVPGTIVKRVLAPYADARAGAALVLSSVPDLAPDFELYVGRAAGTVSLADGVATLATGAWFVGLEAGLRL